MTKPATATTYPTPEVEIANFPVETAWAAYVVTEARTGKHSGIINCILYLEGELDYYETSSLYDDEAEREVVLIDMLEHAEALAAEDGHDF